MTKSEKPNSETTTNTLPKKSLPKSQVGDSGRQRAVPVSTVKQAPESKTVTERPTISPYRRSYIHDLDSQEQPSPSKHSPSPSHSEHSEPESSSSEPPSSSTSDSIPSIPSLPSASLSHTSDAQMAEPEEAPEDRTSSWVSEPKKKRRSLEEKPLPTTDPVPNHPTPDHVGAPSDAELLAPNVYAAAILSASADPWCPNEEGNTPDTATLPSAFCDLLLPRLKKTKFPHIEHLGSFEQSIADTLTACTRKVPLSKLQRKSAYHVIFTYFQKQLPFLFTNPTFPSPYEACHFGQIAELLADTIDPHNETRLLNLQNKPQKEAYPLDVLKCFDRLYTSTLMSQKPPDPEEIHYLLKKAIHPHLYIIKPIINEVDNTSEAPTHPEMVEFLRRLITHPVMKKQHANPVLKNRTKSPAQHFFTPCPPADIFGTPPDVLVGIAISMIADALSRRGKLDKAYTKTREYIKQENAIILGLMYAMGVPDPHFTLQQELKTRVTPSLSLEDIDPWYHVSFEDDLAEYLKHPPSFKSHQPVPTTADNVYNPPLTKTNYIRRTPSILPPEYPKNPPRYKHVSPSGKRTEWETEQAKTPPSDNDHSSEKIPDPLVPAQILELTVTAILDTTEDTCKICSCVFEAAARSTRAKQIPIPPPTKENQDKSYAITAPLTLPWEFPPISQQKFHTKTYITPCTNQHVIKVGRNLLTHPELRHQFSRICFPTSSPPPRPNIWDEDT